MNTSLMYHIMMSVGWRIVLLILIPFYWIGWYEPLVWAGWWVIYHDDRTRDDS